MIIMNFQTWRENNMSQTQLDLQLDAKLLGYERSDVDKVKSVFADMTPDQRIRFRSHYITLLRAIDEKKPHAMPWMRDSWAHGLQILNETMRSTHYPCKLNKRSCVFHDCMGNECRREVVLANGGDFGNGDCELNNLKN